MASRALFFFLVLLPLVFSQSYTTVNGARCARRNLYGSFVNTTTHCVFGFPQQRTLDPDTARFEGITDGPSCYNTLCRDCDGCLGAEYNAGSGLCAACYADEAGAPVTATGFVFYRKPAVPSACIGDADCLVANSTCDTSIQKCYLDCLEGPNNPNCPIHNLGTDQDLIIPPSPIVAMVFNKTTLTFDFDVITEFTRQRSSYVLGLDWFRDDRAISEVGLCENRNPGLFQFDNRNWWCSPSDAFGIGSPAFLAWGPTMSWNQYAIDCHRVQFSRQYTITDLTEQCSQPGSVIEHQYDELIQYDGNFHVTLAQEDSDWSLRSLVPLAKWNYPWQFSFSRAFDVVATLVAQQISTKVKQGVEVVDGNRLGIFVDTRISDIYGPNAYTILVSGMNSSSPIVVFPRTSVGNGLTNAPQGTRTQNQYLKRAADDNTPCVFPQCQQVWRFVSNPIPDDQNFQGVYKVTFAVAGSIQSPNVPIDSFTVSITIDETYGPEKVSKIDNIELGSVVKVYNDPNFSVVPPATGFRESETVYVSQAINLAEEDKNLWELDVNRIRLCLVTDGTEGCKNAVEITTLYENGALQNPAGFSPFLYGPGTVSNNLYNSVIGISFKAQPLANKKPSSRIFWIEFNSVATLANGQKRFVQQNARVEETVLLNVEYVEDGDGGVLLIDDGNKDSNNGIPTTYLILGIAGIAALVVVVIVVIVAVVLLRKPSASSRKAMKEVKGTEQVFVDEENAEASLSSDSDV